MMKPTLSRSAMAFESISDLYATAFLSGVLLHVTVFRLGEWDMYFLTIVSGTLLLDLSATVAVRYGTAVGHESLWVAFQFVSSVLGCCVVGIFSSILVYRLAFHRLNKFPGPFLARISNIYPTALSLKEPKFQLHKEVQALHRQYGDIVRLGKLQTTTRRQAKLLTFYYAGPSELSISDPRAVDLIHSNQSRCYKGPWYNILWPTRPLNALRDRTAHAKRRRAWDKGMGTSGSDARSSAESVSTARTNGLQPCATTNPG